MLKLKGQGDAGRSGGPPGDLYITFVVKASAGMRRRGMDLYSEVRFPPRMHGRETLTDPLPIKELLRPLRLPALLRMQ